MHANLHRLVDERDLLAVRRPVGRVAEPGAERGDLRFRPGAVGRPQRQLVLAAAIAPVRDGLSVRRPSRVPLGDARRAGHVDDRAELGRHGEDIAARFEGGSFAGRRHRTAADERLGLRRARPQRRLVGDDADGHFRDFLGRQIHQVQAAARLVDDRVGPDRRKRDVEVADVGHLAHLARLVRPDVVPLVGAAVRHEVDRLAVPHRLRVVGRVLADVARRERLQIEQPQVRRPSAAIPLPVAEVLRHRHVDELRAVRRVRAELAVRHGQFFRQAAGQADGEELVVALAAALAARGEQHAPAVGRPADQTIRHRMMRQPHRLSSGAADDEDVHVAVVRGAVGDLRPVRGKPREGLLAGRRGQANGRAPLFRHEPDVAGVHERDLILRDGRVSEHPGVDLRRRRVREQRGERRAGADTQQLGIHGKLQGITRAGSPWNYMSRRRRLRLTWTGARPRCPGA